VESTNEWAKELAMSGANEGTVAIAATQTSGRGRRGRKWVSPRGGLWFSIILRPEMRPAEVFKLTFMAGLSTAETLQKLYHLEVETKWPNDVLVNRRKICGILGQANSFLEKVNFAIVGIGINANFKTSKVLPHLIATTATSIEDELGKEISLEELLAALLERLETDYHTLVNSGFASILARWKIYAKFLGQEVKVVDSPKTITGLAENVDEEGQLIINSNSRLRRVATGTVFLRRKLMSLQ
jgi:BirA family biotin operon repressor/biotin-[acetyl-CoA-carboxylase] ligase